MRGKLEGRHRLLERRAISYREALVRAMQLILGEGCIRVDIRRADRATRLRTITTTEGPGRSRRPCRVEPYGKDFSAEFTWRDDWEAMRARTLIDLADPGVEADALERALLCGMESNVIVALRNPALPLLLVEDSSRWFRAIHRAEHCLAILRKNRDKDDSL